jgi:putative tryptophan/tyrosine transport system substrate-binding protein
MRRRQFLCVLGGAAAAWPLTARAQQPERVRRVGVLLSGSEHDPEMQARFNALKRGLAALGWVEGRNVIFEPRWPANDPALTKQHASELARLRLEVAVAGSVIAISNLQEVNSALPIVFANVADPVGGGLIASLRGSGTNVTGFTAFEYGTATKWLEVLKEVAPDVTRVAFVFGAPELGPTGEGFYRTIAAAAPTFGVEVTPIRAGRTADGLDAAIDAFAATPGGGVLTAADQGATNNRSTIIAAVARQRLPAVYPFRYFVADGGLAAYGVDLIEQYLGAAGYVDRILRGAKASDLPIQAPNKFLFFINLRTARALGLTIPATLLARADEVIE